MITPLKGMRSVPHVLCSCHINDTLVCFVVTILSNELCSLMLSFTCFRWLRSLRFFPCYITSLQTLCKVQYMTLSFRLFGYFFRDVEVVQILVQRGQNDPYYVTVQKRTRKMNKYLLSDRCADLAIFMTGELNPEYYIRKRFFPHFLTRFLMA